MAEQQPSFGPDRSPQPAAPGTGPDDRNDATAAAEAFVSGLGEQERMLVLLQVELYEGSWQSMLDDLRNRLDGKPYIFKLANRIRDDIERIEKLRSFEESHQIRLADFVKPPSP